MRSPVMPAVSLRSLLVLTRKAARVLNGSALFLVGALALIVDEMTRRGLPGDEG